MLSLSLTDLPGVAPLTDPGVAIPRGVKPRKQLQWYKVLIHIIHDGQYKGIFFLNQLYRPTRPLTAYNTKVIEDISSRLIIANYNIEQSNGKLDTMRKLITK